jgi:hypothetical protein
MRQPSEGSATLRGEREPAHVAAGATAVDLDARSAATIAQLESVLGRDVLSGWTIAERRDDLGRHRDRARRRCSLHVAEVEAAGGR